jgi:uncharacterized protein (TIGR03437 family)
MKYLLGFIVLLSIFVISTHSTESYVRFPIGSTGISIAWNLNNPGTPIVSNARVTYNLNPAGSADLPFSEIERVLAASFQVWEDIPTSNIAFQRGPNSDSTGTGADGIFQIFWLEDSTTTSDGQNLDGAFGVTLLRAFTTGPRAGEISDVAIVFNGNQFTWATDGRADAADVQEIATHEIGHACGLSHSPIGGSTMFPRTGRGKTQSRSLSVDDQIGVSVIYPTPGFISSTGTISGNVRDNNAAPIFGAHIGAVDSNGVVVSGALSQPDGSYSIQGLPPGNYSVYAEPLDPEDPSFFSRTSLGPFYSNLNTDFLTSPDTPVNVNAGSAAAIDFNVMRGQPAFGAYFVFDAARQVFVNVPAVITQGQNNVTVGVLGPGLPQSGTPLSLSGPGISILRTFFTTSNSGQPAVLAEINVSPSAPPGSRNIIIDNGSQRTIVTGGIEILGVGAPSSITVVSAANFVDQVARESIVSAFGNNLAPTTIPASGGSLPTSLGGTSILLRDSSGNERLAPLFFVSQNQINFQIAPGIQVGQTSFTITNGSGGSSSVPIPVQSVSPGLFTADSTGRGLAAALAVRVSSNGPPILEPISRFDPASGTFVPIPIDLGPTTDQVFLALFGTGIRFSSGLPIVKIGGISSQVTFSGPQGLVGLDQVNVLLDRSLIGRGNVNVELSADGKSANLVGVSIR